MSAYEIYRKETCPYGKKAVNLLNEQGIEFRDHIFSSKEEEEKFKNEHGVKTTPQIFHKEERIGGYTDLADRFGKSQDVDKKQQSYKPVIAVFSVTALTAWAAALGFSGFMGFSLIALAMLKLMDISSFKNGFMQYDLLANQVSGYATIYPFLELFAGLGILAMLMPVTTGLVASFIGIVGGISVFKAVYIDKKDLDCACVGGNQNVPLGAISFLENFMMTAMGLWLLFAY